MDAQIEELAKGCQDCAEVRDNPPAAKLHPWIWPERPWERVHTDFIGPYKGHSFLLLIDARTKWPEIFAMKSTTTEKTIEAFRQTFARYGFPKRVVSDNGPQFTSEDFRTFLTKRGITHTRSPVKHPASNGAAENLVKSFKRKLKIMLKNGRTPQEAIDAFLMEYRSTQHCTTGETPAKLMLGRQIRTKFDLMRPNLDKQQEKAAQRQIRNKKGGRTASFKNGEEVWAKNFSRNGPAWTGATIYQKLGPVTYTVKLRHGEMVKRHVDQLVQARIGGKEGEIEDGQGKREKAEAGPAGTPLRRSPRISAKKNL